MRQVLTEELRTGDRIGRDIYPNAGGVPLLRAGTRVSDSYRRSLQRVGISAVWIDDGLSAGIEPLEAVTETTKQRARVAIHDALKETSHSLATGGGLSDGTGREMKAVAELILGDVEGNAHSALAINDLANADGYTMKHSLAVTTLGLSIGVRVMRKYGWIDAHGKRRFDGVADRLVELGVGLLLHDIGKLAVPLDILQKPGPLTDEEWTAMRAHPTLGFKMLLKADGISPLSRAVVRSHHERWTGKGYPDGQSGEAIHQFARIAAAADVFDAVTSDRYYRRAMPVHKDYDLVLRGSGSDFDPEVVDIFRSSVAPYPTGTTVLLSDGIGGLVKTVRQGEEVIKYPIVRVVVDSMGAFVPPRDVDLLRHRHLTIVSTEMVIRARAPE
jgi:HD-GYP domain-containing protein (c-di-GMP phosphodiesterase class II)